MPVVTGEAMGHWRWRMQSWPENTPMSRQAWAAMKLAQVCRSSGSDILTHRWARMRPHPLFDWF